MTDHLAKAIMAGRERAASYSEDFKTALTFARLEIAELQAGIRDLRSCPGVFAVMKAIVESTRLNFGVPVDDERLLQFAGPIGGRRKHEGGRSESRLPSEELQSICNELIEYRRLLGGAR